jgi:hypothetical protein
MKRTFKVLGLIALAALAGFALAGCGDADGGPAGIGGPIGGPAGPGDPDLSGNITISPNTGVTTGDLLTAAYSGNEDVTYRWNKDGTAISPGGTGTTYTPAEEGSYTVTVSAAGYQSKTSGPVIVTAGSGAGNDIAQYNYNSAVANISFDGMVAGYPLDGLPGRYESNGTARQVMISEYYADLLRRMKGQSAGLKNGYTAVKNAYPALATMLTGVVNGETESFTGIGNTSNPATYLNGAAGGYVDTILDGVFGNNHGSFDAYYSAYTKGAEYNPRVLGDKSSLLSEFNTLFSATGLPNQGDVTAKLAALKTAMLNALNTQMGVNTTITGEDAIRVNNLNSALLTQIAEDIPQFKALTDDISSKDYSASLNDTINTELQYSANQFLPTTPGYAMTTPQKASHILPDFLPGFLKGNGMAMA